MKKIKIKLQQMVRGDYRIAQLTNTVTVYSIVDKFHRVGDIVTEREVEALCKAQNYEVTLDAVRD